MLAYSELIAESAEELLRLEKAQRLSYLRDRLRFLRFLKTGHARSQGEAGSLIGLKQRQSQNIWKKYQEQGLGYFTEPRVNQHWGKLSSHQISQVLQYLDQDGVKTQNEVQSYIADNFGEQFTQAGIHYLFKRLKVKLKTGRPSNIRQDKMGKEDFQKKA